MRRNFPRLADPPEILGPSWAPHGLRSCVGIALMDATGTTVAGCIRGLATTGRTSPEPTIMGRTNTAPIFCCHLGFESASVDESFVANRARRFARDPAHLQAYRVDCGFQFMCLCQRSCRCAVSWFTLSITMVVVEVVVIVVG